MNMLIFNKLRCMVFEIFDNFFAKQNFFQEWSTVICFCECASSSDFRVSDLKIRPTKAKNIDHPIINFNVNCAFQDE